MVSVCTHPVYMVSAFSTVGRFGARKIDCVFIHKAYALESKISVENLVSRSKFAESTRDGQRAPTNICQRTHPDNNTNVMKYPQRERCISIIKVN